MRGDTGETGWLDPAPIRIAAGLLVAVGAGGPRLLLGKRAAGRAFYPGVWDLIGGHVEDGETPMEAMVRELEEEIGVTPLAWWAADHMVIPAGGEGGDPRHELTFWVYAVTAWAGEPRNRQPAEHEAIGWFTIADACALELADASYPALFRRVSAGGAVNRMGRRRRMDGVARSPGEVASLDEVRAEIDRIDGSLIALLAERQGYVRRAAELKRTEAEARAPARVEAVIARVRLRAEEAGLSPEVAERTWRAMIAAFIDQEIAALGREPSASEI